MDASIIAAPASTKNRAEEAVALPPGLPT